jgi:hypothetical protein
MHKNFIGIINPILQKTNSGKLALRIGSVCLYKIISSMLNGLATPRQPWVRYLTVEEPINWH